MGFLMRLQIPPAEKISVLQKLLADDVLEVRSMSCFFLCVCVCVFFCFLLFSFHISGQHQCGLLAGCSEPA